MTITENEQQLIERWIDPGSRQYGRAEARLKQYGVSVWVLMSYWYYGQGDIDVVAGAYNLPRGAVEAALAYYRQHQKYIDARILLNEDAFDV